MIQLITGVIYFLGHVENDNHQGDCLDLVISKPDRERQKLIREQNILKQVTSFSKCLNPPTNLK